MLTAIKNFTSLDDTTLVSISKEFETEIGDAKQLDFYPQVKIKRWGNESNFSIRFPMGAVDPVVVGNSVECENVDAKAHFYEVAGGFEFGITLKSQPATNKLQFTLQHKGLVFLKQPFHYDNEGNPTEYWSDDIGDHYDPLHAQGSYAVYHSYKYNNKYKTGKAFHLYQPWAKDLNGRRVWCEIDITGDILTITLPPDFHQNAVYPIFVDPTLGYTTIGSGTTASGRAWYNTHTATEDGTVTSLWYYIDSGDRDMRVAIYDDDTDFPGSPLAESSSASSGSAGPNWVENTTISLAIINAVKYWFGQHSPDSGNRTIYRDASGGQNVRAGPSVVWTSWPDPYVDSVSAAYIVSMYVEYTEAGSLILKTASDALTASIVDSVNTILAALDRVDSAAISLTEANSILGLLETVADTLSTSVTDAVQAVAAVLSAAETVSASLTESASLGVSLDRADSLAASVSDAAFDITATLMRTDGLALSVSEVRSLLSLVSSSDALTASVSEGASTLTVALAVADALDVSVTDASIATFVLLSRGDGMSAALSESLSLFVTLDRSDSASFSLSETSALVVVLNALDGLSASLNESTALGQTAVATLGRLRIKISAYPALLAAVNASPELKVKIQSYPALNGEVTVNGKE